MILENPIDMGIAVSIGFLLYVANLLLHLYKLLDYYTSM
jgi:hypothetical protein